VLNLKEIKKDRRYEDLCRESDIGRKLMVMIITLVDINFMVILAGIADPNQGGIFRPREIVSFPFDLV
jgi:hypothetical protein